MNDPGSVEDKLCDWCNNKAVYSKSRRAGTNIFLYACGKHRVILEETVEELSKGRMKR